MEHAPAQMRFVGMGELVVSRDAKVQLACVGLGSCVAICAFDPQTRVGGMVHVVLPVAPAQHDGTIARYADTAVPALVTALRRAGARASNVRVALCGGAEIFTRALLSTRIGARNVEAVRRALAEVRLPIVGEEVGGEEGRTVLLHLATGAVHVRSVRRGERVLSDLGGAT